MDVYCASWGIDDLPLVRSVEKIRYGLQLVTAQSITVGKGQNAYRRELAIELFDEQRA